MAGLGRSRAFVTIVLKCSEKAIVHKYPIGMYEAEYYRILYAIILIQFVDLSKSCTIVLI